MNEDCELAHTPRDVMAVTAHALGKLVTASASRRTNHTERLGVKAGRPGVEVQARRGTVLISQLEVQVSSQSLPVLSPGVSY
jgi:hypothetical protein